ncbi:MAG: hypothetical protein ACLGPL_11590 [Acidobacteriota bacterium]
MSPPMRASKDAIEEIMEDLKVYESDPDVGEIIALACMELEDALEKLRRRKPTPGELEVLERRELERMGQCRCYTVRGCVVETTPRIGEVSHEQAR